MTIYAVIWEDRHVDTNVYLFSDEHKAIAWAKQEARNSLRHGELDEELTDAMRHAGWLYYGCYSCEGDNLRVEAKEVDKALTDTE